MTIRPLQRRKAPFVPRNGNPNKRTRTLARKFTVPRGLSTNQTGFPNSLRATLRYSDVVSLSFTASSNVTTYPYNCNGMFDPDFALGGHQPLYFDQMMVVYNHYTVLKSKIKVTFVTDANVTLGTEASVCGIFIDDDATLVTSVRNPVLEQSGGVNVIQTRQGGPRVLTKHWSAKNKFMLTDTAVLAASNMRGNITANPTESSFWIIYFANLLAAVDSSVTMKVEIEYDAIFTERKMAFES